MYFAIIILLLSGGGSALEWSIVHREHDDGECSHDIGGSDS